jgi:hypothetical protein
MHMVTTVGLNIAKSVFQVPGTKASGQVVIRINRTVCPSACSSRDQ